MPNIPGHARSRALAIALFGILIAGAAWHGSPIAAVDACPDLQSMIAGAPRGGTVVAPPCEYRGSFVLDRPITLRAEPGAIIDGRDIWTAWEGRTSVDTIPGFDPADACEPVSACARREIVTVDGVALRLVERNPTGGEFALDAGRHVILGEDPVGHRVEVVVRQTWMVVSASDVTVEGFTMRYASNATQTGALRVNPGVSRFALRDCDLGYAAGANIAFGEANDSVVEDCDIHDAGQLGVHLGGGDPNGRNNVVRNDRIHGNNTAGFDPEWEAGGIKATRQAGLRVEDDTIYGNAGPGMWCDIYCKDLVVTGNEIHDNTHAGIFFEVGTGATVSGNQVWENGWGKPQWGWGAGILISSSGGADVRDNIVAWNYAGISVISQDRQDWTQSATDNYVHSNVVLAEDDHTAVFWAQDWAGILFAPSSNNRGAANRYWFDQAEDGHARFEWEGPKDTLAAFNATPGDEGATYLTDSQKTAILTRAGMPTAPTADPPGATPSRPAVTYLVAAVIGLLVLLSVGAIAVLIRRRKSTSTS